MPVDFTVTAGGSDIKVKKNNSLVLAPGSYGKLEVESSAELTLSSGTYLFKKFKVDTDSVVNLDASGGAIVVKVEKKVELKDRVQMLLLGSPTDVLFLVAGEVKLGKQGTYVGTYLAPYGDVELNDEAVLTGALYGKKVVIKKLAQLNSAPAIDLVISSLAHSG